MQSQAVYATDTMLSLSCDHVMSIGGGEVGAET
jgi:hypothetical protein